MEPSKPPVQFYNFPTTFQSINTRINTAQFSDLRIVSVFVY